mmetsp:Transcript_49576/g.99868  ORF Transcript_49576/g.99868 Transcript_49576/m.99868 type:complete len:190 (-) Transcript_49576:6-575(-)
MGLRLSDHVSLDLAHRGGGDTGSPHCLAGAVSGPSAWLAAALAGGAHVPLGRRMRLDGTSGADALASFFSPDERFAPPVAERHVPAGARRGRASPVAFTFDADTTGGCIEWAKDGACQKNPTFMHTKCQLSCCRTEGPLSYNKEEDSDCRTWARGGQCEKNPDFMKPNCAKSCRECDKVQSVPGWPAPR